MPTQPPPITIGTSEGGQIEIPRAGVYVANVSPGKVGVHFTRSLVDLADFDRTQGLGLWRGNLWGESGANISKERNQLVSRFLDLEDGEWLLLLDSDMVFPKETILRLLASAEVTGAKIVGGLCVLIGALGPIPTLFQFRSEDAITAVQYDYPDDAQLQVAATGAACLMVHRDVFEAYRVKQKMDKAWLTERRQAPDPTLREMFDRDLVHEPSEEFGWFQERVRLKYIEGAEGLDVNEHWIGEDIDFCLRMGALGYPIFVDCSLEIGHAKNGRVWTASDIRDGTGRPKAAIAAVIPVKDRLRYTTSLVRQLREQGCDEIVIIDNGSGKTTKNWLSSQDDLTVLDMPDVGIHAMWNAGIDHALDKHGPRTHIAILNNDLELGPEFLKRLSHALDDRRDLTAVCGNYDGRRTLEAVVETTDICANRYDGTGGFAGFAFMVRGEWFSSGYRFPEECMWWFGDNDLIASIVRADTHRGYDDRPCRAGIVTAAAVTHLDGGGKSAGDPLWSKFKEQTDRDQEAFVAKWSKIASADAAMERIKAGDLTPLYEHLCTQPSDINEHLATMHDLAVKLDAQHIIELGVRTGVSSVAWLAALHQTGGHLWSVDIDPAPPMVSGHKQCTFIQGDDLDPEVLDQVPDQVDIVFIDTIHTYEQTKQELFEYVEYVKLGGCIVLHDIAVERFDHHIGDLACQPLFPVRKAVEEFAAERDLKVDWYEHNNGLAVVWIPDIQPADSREVQS